MSQAKPNLLLLHGWGVNSRVWDGVVEPLGELFDVKTLDLRGYGSQAALDSGTCLVELATDILDRAPETAIWCGWSLGGMVAMEAALQQPQRISRLQLVCSTPRFSLADDWQHGASEDAIGSLSTQFQKDYPTALSRFFLMQIGAVPDARSMARTIADVVATGLQPSYASLMQGLDLLRAIDLRNRVAELAMPVHIVAGVDDQLINPASGRFLHAEISGSTLTEMPSGHVPFLTSPIEFVDDLVRANVGAY